MFPQPWTWLTRPAHPPCCLTSPNPRSPPLALPPSASLRFSLFTRHFSPALLLETFIGPNKSLPLSSPPAPVISSQNISLILLQPQRGSAGRCIQTTSPPYAAWFRILWFRLSPFSLSSNPVSLRFIHLTPRQRCAAQMLLPEPLACSRWRVMGRCRLWHPAIQTPAFGWRVLVSQSCAWQTEPASLRLPEPQGQLLLHHLLSRPLTAPWLKSLARYSCPSLRSLAKRSRGSSRVDLVLPNWTEANIVQVPQRQGPCVPFAGRASAFEGGTVLLAVTEAGRQCPWIRQRHSAHALINNSKNLSKEEMLSAVSRVCKKCFFCIYLSLKSHSIY